MNKEVQIYFGWMFLYYLDKCPEVRYLDHMVVVILIFFGGPGLLHLWHVKVYQPENKAVPQLDPSHCSDNARSLTHLITGELLLLIVWRISILLSIVATSVYIPTNIFFLYLHFFGDAPVAHGGSQARGLIGAVSAGLCHSRSKLGSKPRLRPTPQLTATPDPQLTEQGQGSNPQPHGS